MGETVSEPIRKLGNSPIVIALHLLCVSIVLLVSLTCAPAQEATAEGATAVNKPTSHIAQSSPDGQGYDPGALPTEKPIPATAAQSYGAVRHVQEINPFQKELEICYLPACRVIGVEQTYGPEPGGDRAAAPQWQRVIASKEWEAIAALPRVIPRSCFGWTCDDKPEAKTFQYLVAVLTPAGTAVPEGCQFRDVPPTLVAAGRWDEPMDGVLAQMKQLGYVSHWGDKGCSWNAELYLDEEEGLPAPNGQEWRWLIPIKEADFTLSDRHPCHVKLSAFEVIGFSKIVASGGEQYGEVRGDGRWEQLRHLGGEEPTIYGVAAEDTEAPKGRYRYTVGVKATEALLAKADKPENLFTLRIPASDWLIFRLNFKDLFGQLWRDNPYRLVTQVGWDFNTDVNLHSDVFNPCYVKDGEDDFEFWMPVKRP